MGLGESVVRSDGPRTERSRIFVFAVVMGKFITACNGLRIECRPPSLYDGHERLSKDLKDSMGANCVTAIGRDLPQTSSVAAPLVLSAVLPRLYRLAVRDIG